MDLWLGVALCLALSTWALGLCPALTTGASECPVGCLVCLSLPSQLLDQELQHELLAHHSTAHSLCYWGE